MLKKYYFLKKIGKKSFNILESKLFKLSKAPEIKSMSYNSQFPSMHFSTIGKFYLNQLKHHLLNLTKRPISDKIKIITTIHLVSIHWLDQVIKLTFWVMAHYPLIPKRAKQKFLLLTCHKISLVSIRMILNLRKFNLSILNNWIAVVISSSMLLFNLDLQKSHTCQKKCLGWNKIKMMKQHIRTKRKTRKK